MKLKNKVLFGLLFLFSCELSGQQARIVDLRVKIISPLKGSSIKSPGVVLVKFSIFNKGPDDLKPSDTIFYYPETNDTLFKSKRVFSSKNIAAGDSEVFSLNIPFNAPYDNNYYILGIGGLTAYNRSPDSLRRESHNWQKDNSNYITVQHRSATSNINILVSSNQFIIYPNPANEFFNIGFAENLKMTNIAIFNSNWIILKEYQLNNFNKGKLITTDDLPTGVYFVKGFNNLTSFYSKLTIIH